MHQRETELKDILLYCIENADGWVINNMRRYGNSVFPNELIDCPDDIRIAEKLVSCILGEEVRITETNGGYVCEMLTINGRSKKA